MCQMKSGIILKDRIFIPDYDHHTQMLEELSIKDSRKNAESLFVRAELIPPNDDFFSDIDTWRFNVDQDIIPEWFVADYENARMITAVKEWAKNRIYIGTDGLELSTGTNYYLKDCKNVTLRGDASVERLYGSTVGQMWESSTVGEMWESSTVGEMWGSSTVGQMWGSSTVGQMRESSTGIIAECWSNGVNVENIIICDNATIKDNRTKTIYQSGDWKLVAVDSK